jgi:thiamine kinase-like enzyme
MFEIQGDFVSAKPFDRGLINDTYIAAYETSQGKIQKYICQKINQSVFTKPKEVMENISLVTDFVHQKAKSGESHLLLQKTKNGEPYHLDGNGDFWRMYNFIKDSTTFNTAQSPQQAYEAAYAFGNFQSMISELDPNKLHKTIPHFHNTPIRYETFLDALAKDEHNRALSCKKVIDAIQAREHYCDVFMKMGRENIMPDRISHNDTKLNNVLFDTNNGRALCVIDLDTVMPGQSLFDFGDLVRTATSPTDEDEVDLSKIKLQMPLFEAIARGYHESTKSFLSQIEKENMVFAGKLITYEVAIRFLTDYLVGDEYFKISYERQNRNRSKAQMRLVECIEEQEEQMNRFVESLDN